MKDHNTSNKTSDELDLIQIFDYIGYGIKKLFSLIYKFFKEILRSLLYLFKTAVDNFVVILIVVFVSFGIGFLAEKLKKPIYKSEMLVKPHFDSKYQLVSNINYYNALIEDKNHLQLSQIFKISEEDSKQLVNFDIEPGPETKNDQIKQYDDFMKSIDSIRAQGVSFEDFVDNRDLYNGEIFLVEVSSSKKDIFKSLESGFYNTFENKYAIEKKRKRDSLLANKKNAYLQTIEDIDSLQKVYIGVLKEETKNKISSIKINEGLLPLEQEKRETKEFELLHKKAQLRDSIRDIEGRKIDEDTFFDVVSGFQSVGTKTKSFKNKYSLIFPIISFFGLCLIFVVYKVKVYVKQNDI